MRGAAIRSLEAQRFRKSVALGFFLFAPLLVAQDYAISVVSRHVLTNEGIIALAKAGFDEWFIVERIRTTRTHFDASVQGLVNLKQAGLSEDLIREVALQDHRNFLAERRIYTAPPDAETAPAGAIRVMVENHWWGFRWVRVLP